jgi:REP element-mobilizing transposase RayT
MTYARKTLISLQDTRHYHVVARCVRRAWLWGYDEYAGKDYSHRKEWVLERLAQLGSIFAIDVCAYAVMSNHYHLVIHVDQAAANAWTPQEVIARWTALFSRPPLIERWEQRIASDAEREVAEQLVERWRVRLSDVSWYMRCLNEHLARRANAEDNCNGRFWQGRFKSQALLDEAGLLTAMAYVELNPIRAGIAGSPEESEFTSIYERIGALRAASRDEEGVDHSSSVPLMPFHSPPRKGDPISPRGLSAARRLERSAGSRRQARRDGRARAADHGSAEHRRRCVAARDETARQCLRACAGPVRSLAPACPNARSILGPRPAVRRTAVHLGDRDPDIHARPRGHAPIA